MSTLIKKPYIKNIIYKDKLGKILLHLVFELYMKNRYNFFNQTNITNSLFDHLFSTKSAYFFLKSKVFDQIF